MVPDLRICGPSLFLDLGVGGHSLCFSFKKVSAYGGQSQRGRWSPSWASLWAQGFLTPLYTWAFSASPQDSSSEMLKYSLINTNFGS
jgi:hypothetical protein